MTHLEMAPIMPQTVQTSPILIAQNQPEKTVPAPSSLIPQTPQNGQVKNVSAMMIAALMLQKAA
eukprot:CAMPEP_0202947258 /NCGR_PEP_ID=MMETSP1395-20130829/11331_1 /ASSEMBLY_ACC=CAM_ASM_000871 /TAXON_ID=5961 /ORGANISM="Blepharisma japonicum, Strain Stock R1072" /LENGTH=63 /DNA_ID=CAMNT_0049648419 /DNA_START=155 /DNA_END=346 /DNA_ORIENTATION=+